MKLNGAQTVVKCLLKENVDTIFSYQGGVVIPIFDELYKSGKINMVRPSHEQCGTHAADAYARTTGKVGVVLVTSGPGASNTVTGIANAHMDSVPMVIISGQVSLDKIGTDAFQEVDIRGITLAITKASFMVTDIKDLVPTFKKAFYLANSGRKGPVLIDIPVTILFQEEKFDYPKKISIAAYNPTTHGNLKQIRRVTSLIKDSKRPIIISGGGVISSNSTKYVESLAQLYNIPIVNTLMGNGVYPKKKELYLGPIGMHGSLYVNKAIGKADLIIALGTRFSDRITGSLATFAKKASIVQIDVDPAEIGKNTVVALPIVGDLHLVLKEILSTEKVKNNTKEWIKTLLTMKNKYPLSYREKKGVISPQKTIQLINKYFPDDTIICTDVGQTQMWITQYYNFKKPRTIVTSGGLGAMGFGLPASIGSKIGNPKKMVLAISGDGGFQMTMQDLITVKNYNLDIKIVVMDNKSLGMVRQWQKLLCQKRYSETILDKNPDFVAVAKAYGINATRCDNPDHLEDCINELRNSKGAKLLHILIDPWENVLPMVPSGKSLNDCLDSID